MDRQAACSARVAARGVAATLTQRYGLRRGGRGYLHRRRRAAPSLLQRTPAYRRQSRRLGLKPMGSGLVGLAVVTSSGWGPIPTRPLGRRARSPASPAPRGRQPGRLVVSAPYGVTDASALIWIACGPLLRRCATCFRAPGTNARPTDPLSTYGAVVGRATIDRAMRTSTHAALDGATAEERRG